MDQLWVCEAVAFWTKTTPLGGIGAVPLLGQLFTLAGDVVGVPGVGGAVDRLACPRWCPG